MISRRGIEQQRAHDLDALALADAQRRDDAARIELQPVGSSTRPNSASRSRCDGSDVEAERDVLQHRQRLEQREVLEHHADAERRAARGLAMWTGAPFQEDLPGVGREDAVDHLDERRLAGAVLAEQRVDLARPDAEIDVVVGEHAGKRLVTPTSLRRGGVSTFTETEPRSPQASSPRRQRPGVYARTRRGPTPPCGAPSAPSALRPRRHFFDRNDPALRVNETTAQSGDGRDAAAHSGNPSRRAPFANFSASGDAMPNSEKIRMRKPGSSSSPRWTGACASATRPASASAMA